jgi:hypothetical protein
MKKKLEFKAFLDGKEIVSTGHYDLNHCIADECTDIGMNLSMLVTSMFTEEAEHMDMEDF